MDRQSNGRPTVKACHVCEGSRLYYLFSASEHRVVRCEDCGLVFINPQPAPGEGTAFRSAADGSKKSRPAAKAFLATIHRYRGSEKGRLLEIGGEGEFLTEAEGQGWHTTGVREWTPGVLPAESFDLCVVSRVLASVRSPVDFLRQLHGLLKPGGTLVVATRAIHPRRTAFVRQKRMDWDPDWLTCFDRDTLQTVLFKSDFRDIIAVPDVDGPRRPDRTGMTEDVMVFAKKHPVRPTPVLSVIVPAFNEAKTFGVLMDALLQKELPGLRLEVIVVESGSTDGTREAALRYRDHPAVKLVLEEQPRGKGHAVRAGLQAATGDYLLIQDADLEYDLEDYDALLAPLVAGRAAFVLGSRHGGRNVLKMRQFAGQHGLSLFFNVGHWFFTALINILFFQRLHDPFTMFKVFRRDCLYGLEFECNRFDFDFELLVKLIRKGYRPIELPVNYRSRSYDEGKKVRLFRDPLAWLRTIAWLRFVRVDPLAVIEQGHPAPRQDRVSPASVVPKHEHSVTPSR